MNRPLPPNFPSKAMPREHAALAVYMAEEKEFRGIGMALAGRLSDRFGANLREALAARHTSVIDLLGHDLAETVFAAFTVRSQEVELIEWLEQHGIVEAVGVQTAIRIARCWGGDGVSALTDNPYLLAAFLPWRTVENVAAAFGIAPHDPRRIAAAVEAVLYAGLDRNHTWILERDVEAGVAKLLNGVAAPAGSQAQRPVDAAVLSGGATRLGDGVQPFGAAIMEEEIARWVSAAVRAEPYHDLIVRRPSDAELDDRIQAFEDRQPHALTAMQKTAITTAVKHRIMVLAGYAGSGKTTSLRGICDIADSLGRQTHLMALSGRAAQRMSVATGRPARTIAGFLQSFAGASAETVSPGAMLIIDEASMLDLPTFWRIMRAVGQANLVLVGDPAQLPPIGFGLTFHILCRADHVPRVVLDQIMRQSSETGIPTVAAAIRNGHVPHLHPYYGLKPGISFIACSPDDAVGRIAEIGRDFSDQGAERGETQILAAVKSGASGIAAVNHHFHAIRNSLSNAAYFPGRIDMAGGDPVIWTQNDWDRELMNGSMGRIHSVIDGIAHATMDGKPFEFTAADAPFLDLAYAISVHKAQGSQWPRIIVPVFPSRLLDRTLLYTAVTRATEQVVLVGDPQAFRRAIEDEPRSLMRTVGLEKRLHLNLVG